MQAEVTTAADLHRIQKFSANTAVWLFVRDPKTLDEIEREDSVYKWPIVIITCGHLVHDSKKVK